MNGDEIIKEDVLCSRERCKETWEALEKNIEESIETRSRYLAFRKGKGSAFLNLEEYEKKLEDLKKLLRKMKTP